MAKKSESSSQVINLHSLYAGFAVCGILLALLAMVMPPAVAALFLGSFGLFENLTVLLYVLAFVLVAKILWQRNHAALQPWKANEKWVLLAALAIVLAGEELQWLLPWIYADTYHDFHFYSLSGLVDVSRGAIPEDASLKVVAAIAGIRLSAVMLAIYGLLGLIYYREKIMGARAYLKNYTVRYAVVFVLFLILSALMRFGIIPGSAIFEDCLEMLAAGAFAASVFRESTI